MDKIYTFEKFMINESSSAGNRDQIDGFVYGSNDQKDRYDVSGFIDYLEKTFIDNPEVKPKIIDILSKNLGILDIHELNEMPFSLISDIIKEIEEKIGKYEVETIMPGGALLFIRNKQLKDGKGADFYINKKGTKIEVITENAYGEDKSIIYRTLEFNPDKYGFTKDECEKLESLIKAKGIK